MNEKRMSILLQTIIVCVALCAIGILAYAVPEMGRAVALHNPDYAHCYWPWVILLWVVSIPGFVGLAYCMLIARDMGRGEAFSERNASRFGITAMLAASDGVLFFGANVVYLFLNMSHPGVTLGAFFIMLVCFALAIVLWGLSYYTRKASCLREDAELTI